LINNIYGSSRVGIKNTNRRVTALAYNIQGGVSDIIIPETINPLDPVKRSLGEKQYELSNHLGNVLVTVSDRKLAEGTEGSTATGYRAEVLFASDYYPFGMQMPGREFSQEEYRYGFQGQETDKEWLGGAVSYKYRVHDARIGRFLSVDPLAPDYPHNSPYAFSENRVIDGVELEGLEFIDYWNARIKINNFGSAVIRVSTMSETYQENWDNHLTALGIPPSSMDIDNYLASREPERFTVIPAELLTRPSILDDDMEKGFIENANKEIPRYTLKGKLDRRYNSTKRIKFNAKMAKGMLVVEAIGLAVEAIQGWGAMFDSIDLNEDSQVLDQQFAQLFLAVDAINSFISSNEVSGELLEGENAVNLTNYVLYGEMNGSNEGVFKLGDDILDSVGKNDKVKFRKPQGDEE
jgi:RHS repeat-associated protein